jgi:uncharacterized protein (DUF427 family)
MSALIMGALPELRFEPSPKRIRAVIGGETWADTVAGMVVWEPGRIVPGYAVPETDLDAEPIPAGPASAEAEAEAHPVQVHAGGPPVLDPRTPFSVRTTEGEPVSLRRRRARGSVVLDGAGFRPADPDLAGYVILDWSAFDQWLEEDDEVFAHSRDPFKRIDVRSSSRHVVVSVDGVVLADTTRARLLFETHLPTRTYFPRSDVRLDLLEPSDTRSWCAYKGHAIVMYCEGGRSRTGTLSEQPKRGIGRLALESGAPVVPMAIYGSSRVRNWKRAQFPRVHVAYGDAIRWPRIGDPTRDQQQATANEIFARIKKLYATLDG